MTELFAFKCLGCGANLPSNLECTYCGTRHKVTDEGYKPPWAGALSWGSSEIPMDYVADNRRWAEEHMIRVTDDRLIPGYPVVTVTHD